MRGTTARLVRDGARTPRADRRGPRRDRGGARDQGDELLDLRVPIREALADARPDRGAQRPGRDLPDRRDRPARRRRRRGRGQHRRRVVRGRCQHAGRTCRCCSCPARPHQPGSHARRRDDRRSRDDLDRGRRRDRARRHAPSVRLAARTHPDRNRGRRSNRTPSPSTPRSEPARSWDHSVTFAPERSSRRIRRRVPSWRSRTHASGHAPRSRTSRTSAMPRSARTRTSGPARSPRTLRHKPGVPKGRTRIGDNVRVGIQNGFVAPVEVGDGAWTAAGSTITKDVPADGLAVARARQENKEGYASRHRDD